jgi:S1-C subfamily serine protease
MTIKVAVDSVKTTGKISRPYIGVRYIPITAAVKTQQNLPVDYGVLVTKGKDSTEPAVIPNSPAAKAGLTQGDIILEIDGTKLPNHHLLQQSSEQKKSGIP